MTGIVTITAPSQTGKTTVINKLVELTDYLVKPTQFTTRKRRETDSDDEYNFISKEQFITKINNKELAEWVEYAGNYYGICKKGITKAVQDKKTTIFAATYDATTEVEENFFDLPTLKILMLPDRPQTFMERRFKLINTTTAKQIEQRLQHASSDIAKWWKYDHIVVNVDGGIYYAISYIKAWIDEFIEANKS